jgi:purine-binding chemotaxis protein CheW
VSVHPDAARRQHIDAVLAERARLLAQPAVEISAVPAVDVVAFSAGGERYAIEAAYVRRLERPGRITLLPGAPRHFAGVTNLHGALVPLIDLCALLGDASTANATFAIVLGNGRAEFGIVAESLHEIRAVPDDMLSAPPGGQSLVRRILPDGSAVIDAAALIADPRLVIGEISPDAHEENPR